MGASNYSDDGPLIYKSRTFQKVVTQGIDAGGNSDPLLLLGEAGVGQGVVAKFIHAYGIRRDYPTVRLIASGGDTEDVIRNLLGGVEVVDGRKVYRVGVLGEVEGGTLIVHHVEYLEREIQMLLARILREGRYRVPGMRGYRKVNVKFIFTAYVDFIVPQLRDQLVGNVINIPPLADRPQDVRALYRHWCGRLAARARSPGNWCFSGSSGVFGATVLGWQRMGFAQSD